MWWTQVRIFFSPGFYCGTVRQQHTNEGKRGKDGRPRSPDIPAPHWNQILLFSLTLTSSFSSLLPSQQHPLIIPLTLVIDGSNYPLHCWSCRPLWLAALSRSLCHNKTVRSSGNSRLTSPTDNPVHPLTNLIWSAYVWALGCTFSLHVGAGWLW